MVKFSSLLESFSNREIMSFTFYICLLEKGEGMVITNCILFIGSDDKELINDVNRFEGSGIGFIGLDNPSMPASFIHLRFVDTEVYVGRFPNLDITLLEEHFRSIPWTQLNRV